MLRGVVISIRLNETNRKMFSLISELRVLARCGRSGDVLLTVSAVLAMDTARAHATSARMRSVVNERKKKGPVNRPRWHPFITTSFTLYSLLSPCSVALPKAPVLLRILPLGVLVPARPVVFYSCRGNSLNLHFQTAQAASHVGTLPCAVCFPSTPIEAQFTGVHNYTKALVL